MQKTAALWFEPGSSQHCDAWLWIADDMLHVQNEYGEQSAHQFSDISISSRLGDIPRQLHLKNGVLISVADNAFIDNALSSAGQTRRSFFIHRLESRFYLIPVFLLLTVAVLYGLYTSALPAVARYAATLVPPAYVHELSETVYKNIQNQLLSETTLTGSQQAQAHQQFAIVAAQYSSEQYNLRLRLHQFEIAETEIANAFALPDGLVIVTDKAMRLLTKDELTAVIAHEIGHVYHAHGMQSVMRGAGLALLAFLITGDVSGLALVPLVLANAGYSRDFEREADCFSYYYLLDNNLPSTLIGTALNKMESAVERDTKQESSKPAPDNSEETQHSQWQTLVTALSSHPSTEQRQDLAQHCQ